MPESQIRREQTHWKNLVRCPNGTPHHIILQPDSRKGRCKKCKQSLLIPAIQHQTTRFNV